MKKNDSWTLCKPRDFNNVRLYHVKTSGEFVLTNFNDDVISLIPKSERGFKFDREMAYCVASGFQDEFFNACYCDNKKLMCFICSYVGKCSCFEPYTKKCQISIDCKADGY